MNLSNTGPMHSSICTLLTAKGRSAVAVIGVRGVKAMDAIRSGFTAATKRPIQINEIRYGSWHGGARGPESAGESVVVLMRGDQQVEIHCHGGTAAMERILSDLQQAGITRVTPDEWARSRGEPLLHQEARQTLSHCLSGRTAAIAMDQLRGALSNWASCSRDAFLSDAEDQRIDVFHRDVDRMITHGQVTARLTQPFRVALIGRPNVGKSSLINAIVGYDRSIITPLAGTTRDVLHAETVIEGIPIRLSDTAGIHAAAEAIEKEGVSRALAEAKQADLVLTVETHDCPPVTEIDPSIPTLSVLNKRDLIAGSVSCSRIQTVATTGEGVEELIAAIAEKLGDGFPPAGTAVPINQRQWNCLRLLQQAETSTAILDGLARLIHGDREDASNSASHAVFENSDTKVRGKKASEVP
ncbi:GTPase [Novipirellula artificiosorum]|uniref:tRNA modification GTPase MnmE n=1 Tax=Novipirellula artificiosorum TaxID=2528016 RepID=A0A5C6D4H9_9BACT|nr:GTPase [Novipirellula artificiosorum]TWU31710.1 tRNA modification GTPase MnmE [Novipirellula artificiosorum]